MQNTIPSDHCSAMTFVGIRIIETDFDTGAAWWIFRKNPEKWMTTIGMICM
jgi:hypothetical protein